MNWKHWFRSAAVKNALTDSANRLADTKGEVAELRNVNARLKDNFEKNHVVTNIMASFGLEARHGSD